MLTEIQVLEYDAIPTGKHFLDPEVGGNQASPKCPLTVYQTTQFQKVLQDLNLQNIFLFL
jgi:hypothetical protein